MTKGSIVTDIAMYKCLFALHLRGLFLSEGVHVQSRESGRFNLNHIFVHMCPALRVMNISHASVWVRIRASSRLWLKVHVV